MVNPLWRTNEEFDTDILSACLIEPMMISHLLRKVNINYNSAMRKLDYLIGEGFIEEIDPSHIKDKKVKRLYGITDCGIDQLKLLSLERYTGVIRAKARAL